MAESRWDSRRGDGVTHDLRIPGGETAMARPPAFPDGGIGPRPSPQSWSRWDSRRGMGQGTALGIPGGETAIAHDQRHFHAHNGSSPASFPRPQRQRRCAIQPGVAPIQALPRVQAAARSPPRKGLCRLCPSGGWIKHRRDQIRFHRPEEESAQEGCPLPKKYHIPPVRPFGTTPLGVVITLPILPG